MKARLDPYSPQLTARRQILTSWYQVARPVEFRRFARKGRLLFWYLFVLHVYSRTLVLLILNLGSGLAH